MIMTTNITNRNTGSGHVIENSPDGIHPCPEKFDPDIWDSSPPLIDFEDRSLIRFDDVVYNILSADEKYWAALAGHGLVPLD
jgi:hypothetical protein